MRLRIWIQTERKDPSTSVFICETVDMTGRMEVRLPLLVTQLEAEYGPLTLVIDPVFTCPTCGRSP